MKQREALFGNLNIPNYDPAQDIKKIRRLTVDKQHEIELKVHQTALKTLEDIRINVRSTLSKYTDKVELLVEDEVERFVDTCIRNGIVAVDTETTGLNPISDSVLGVCLYTPGRKAVYISYGHFDYFTQKPFENQVSFETIQTQLKRLEDVRCIFHNAVFDIRFLRHSFGVYLTAFWDTMIGSKILDENESAALKFQYADKIEHKHKEYDFGTLFKHFAQQHVDPETFHLYAATDPLITYELFKYQFAELSKPEHSGLLNVATSIEFPLVDVISNMEDRGIALDEKMAKTLSVQWTKKKDEALHEIYSYIDENFGEQIKEYKLTNPNHKLSNPILLTSPSQLATLFYDILRVKVANKEKPRSTEEKVMKQLSKDYPVCKKILDYRSIEKMLNTYIDNLPTMLNEKTHKIHTRFNQYGAKTGRLSSDGPNLQNIPGRGPTKIIRLVFVPDLGKKFVGGDYSQQEIRILAQFTQDPGLLEAYRTNRDVYAWAASLMYHKEYEECLEFFPVGSKLVYDGDHYNLAKQGETETHISTGEEPFRSKDGKTLRGSIKAIVLGILYGKGVESTAEDMKVTKEEAQFLFDSFFKTFKTVKPFMDESENMARNFGYVETLWGRRRRLPDMMLPMYEFQMADTEDNFNPFLDTNTKEVKKEIIDSATRQLDSCRSLSEKYRVIDQLSSSGIKVKQNGGFISRAVRQCVNSRIQGSAADLTKLAMIKIENDSRLKELGFELMLTIHDEVIGQCPENNIQECARLIREVMIDAGHGVITVPIKVDVVATSAWDGENILK